MAFFRLIRLPNLLIVALTQGVLYQYVLLPALHSNGLSPQLNEKAMMLYILVTVILTATGYIINDLIDIQADQINKPHKIIITRSISIKSAQWLYLFFGLIGFFLTVYLGLSVGRAPLISIYPLAFLLLYFYSAKWKNLPLIGNLLISTFCAGVAGAIWLAEQESLLNLQNVDPNRGTPVQFLLIWYMVFAFFSTLYREIVKDMEDIHGDKAIGARTAPIVWGITKSKWVAAGAGGILIIFLVIQSAQIFSYFPLWATYVLWLGLVLPIIISLYLLIFAYENVQFRRISTIIKCIMLNGIILLFFAQL